MADKKRAVAYCRVSTDSDNQNNSYESQQRYFKMYFDDVDNIDFDSEHGIYSDKGLSGTKLSRPGFDRMMVDAGLQKVVDKETNRAVENYKIIAPSKFDYIYVNNISRFSRNISADGFIKTLAMNHVYVVFVDASDNVYSTENEQGQQYIIDGIVSAERFSRELSAKVKKGQKQGARNGNIYCNPNIYGYTYIYRNLNNKNNGNYLQIDEKEADVVRRIYSMYCDEGYGSEIIARKLAEEGIFTRTNKRFTSTSILGILKNEKYCGVNNAMHITTGSVFGDRRHKNIDYDDKVRVKARQATEALKESGIEKIPAIITVAQWEKAQEIRNSRTSSKQKGIYNGKTDYAGLLVCGLCGCTYQAAGVKHMKEGMRRYYMCRHRYRYDTEHGIPKCENPSVSEERLNEVLNSNGYSLRRLNRITDLIAQIKFAISELNKQIDKSNDKEVEKLKQELSAERERSSRLLDVYLDNQFSKEIYEERNASIKERIQKLETSISALSKTNDEIRADIAKLKEYLKKEKSEHDSLVEKMNKGELKNLYSRKELMFDIDRIIIDTDGEPHLHFKSLNDIEAFTDSIVKTYNLSLPQQSKPKTKYQEIRERSKNARNNDNVD